MIEKLSFNPSHIWVLGLIEFAKTQNDYFQVSSGKNNLKSKKYYAGKFSETTGIEIQSWHWDGNRQLSMEGIAVAYFSNSVDPGRNETESQFHSYTSDENEQYGCDSHAHMITVRCQS